MYKRVDLVNKGRYSKESPISKDKLEKAIEHVLCRLEKNYKLFEGNLVTNATGFRKSHPEGFSLNRYTLSDKLRWTNGMWTGMYWLAYAFTGEDKYKDMALSQLEPFFELSKHPEKLIDHDTGFKFTPSCVAAYELTGNQEARKAALAAAKVLLDHYCPVNRFIIRIGTRSEKDEYSGYRTIVDCMMNIPLFFWAYKETGDKAYYDAAVGHYQNTAKYLVREDGSSYHHYQFDPITLEPVRGLTFQGYQDETCWSRGHAWLISGYPLAYRYTEDAEIFDIYRSVTNYFLDHLPSNNLPFWDFAFNDGSIEPRDSSAAAIAACGLYEMCKYLPDSAEEKKYYKNAADMMLETLIDTCVVHDEDMDALITHVTGAKPHAIGVDGCAIYGDYFYFEALVHALKPEMKMFW